MSLDMRINIDGIDEDIYLHIEGDTEIDLYPFLTSFFFNIETKIIDNKKNILKFISTYNRFKKNDSDIGKECVICTDLFRLNEGKRTLVCGHVYHKKCIDKWILDYKTTCPLCRQKIL
jgi:hypothetical protein